MILVKLKFGGEKSGFSLIELIIAIFVSSILSIGLYQLLRQTRFMVTNLVEIIDTDVPLMTFYNQLERDIYGIFIPSSTEKYWVKQKKQEQNSMSRSGEQEKAQEGEQGQISEQEKKGIENIFYIESKNGGFTWSFITTAGLDKYSKLEKINNVPYVRRVAYKLEKDPANPRVSRLMYSYSADNLKLKDIEKSDFKPSYEILGNIKNLSFEFTVFEVKKEKQESKENQNKSVSLDKWVESEMAKKYESLVPAYITIKGAQTDAAGKAEFPFEFQFKVLGYHHIKKEEKKSVPTEPGKLLSEIEQFGKKLFGQQEQTKAQNAAIGKP